MARTQRPIWLLIAATAGIAVPPANGDVSFSDHDEYLINTTGGAYTYTRCVATGDLDLDGTEDVIVTDRYNENIILFLNDGTGQLTETDSIYATEQNRIVVVVDVNNDGFPDLATACKNGANVFINRGNGSDGWLNFALPVLLHAGANPHWIEHADLNDDGYADLLVADFGEVDEAGGWYAYINRGDGTFEDGLLFDWGINARCISIACNDLNQDGLDDIAVLGRYTEVAIYLNHGADPATGAWLGALYASTTHLTKSGACSIRAGDFEQDGDIDFAIAHRTAPVTSLLTNDGNGGFTGHTISTSQSEHAELADIDRDGDVDLLLAHKHSGRFTTLLNNGEGGFTTAYQSSPIYSIDTKYLACSDLDQDQDLDVILVDAYLDEDKGAIRVFFNETPCNAMSLNDDCLVDVLDLLLLIESWGHCDLNDPCDADYDDDGEVEIHDLLSLIASWSS